MLSVFVTNVSDEEEGLPIPAYNWENEEADTALQNDFSGQGEVGSSEQQEGLPLPKIDWKKS